MYGNTLVWCGYTFSSQHWQRFHTSQFRLNVGLPGKGCTALLFVSGREVWKTNESPNAGSVCGQSAPSVGMQAGWQDSPGWSSLASPIPTRSSRTKCPGAQV